MRSIREHIPLEQGLRPISHRVSPLSVFIIREHIPLEQGLRQLCDISRIHHRHIREHIPLEQGLRPLQF